MIVHYNIYVGLSTYLPMNRVAGFFYVGIALLFTTDGEKQDVVDSAPRLLLWGRGGGSSSVSSCTSMSMFGEFESSFASPSPFEAYRRAGASGRRTTRARSDDEVVGRSKSKSLLR
mmetsp:Transcript_28002/g.62003  ORF Transcript_28002/g.62003 Transcript_28002/m.62003 type:complete len:116 (+) Transcript_28002:145-492(+)